MQHDLQLQVDGQPQLSGSMDMMTPPGAAAAAPSGSTISLRNSSHPTVCIFHVLFKALALIVYIFGGWFSRDGHGGKSGAHFITVTVVCILLLAADFWVVKNVTGRLLVGLRWWNQVDGDTTRWIFESKGEAASNKTDSRIFWTVLYATPIIWGALFVFGLLKLQFGWLLVVCMALALNTSNVYGYYKCSSDQKVKFQAMVQQHAQAGMMTAMRSNLFGMLVGSVASANNNAGAAAGTPAATSYV